MAPVKERIPKSGSERTTRYKEGVLARIISTTQDSVVFIDSSGAIVEFNRAAEATFGYEAREVLGCNVKMLMPDPYRKEHDGYLENYKRTGEARAIGTIRTVKGRRKSGEVFPLELSITELPPDSPVRYAAFLRDISEKSEMQAKLLEQQRLASLGMASSILAHEVGNPLNNIGLEAQLLSRRMKKTADPSAARIGNILDEIERLRRLLDEFRSVARVHQHAFEPCDLADVGDYTVRQIEQQAKDFRIVLERKVEWGRAVVQGHPDKLRQVALNLAKNAIEAMPDGGTLRLTVTVQEDLAVLTVEDTGVGVPEGVKILDAFQTTKPNGTGLGLAIVNQIVTSHRGCLSWQSVPGMGTLFRVALPMFGQENSA